MPVLLFVFWIIMNGKVTVEILLIGLVVTAIACWFAYKMMGLSFRAELRVWKHLVKILLYLVMLVKEVYWANLDVIERVLTPNNEQKPVICFFKTDLKTNMARVALANSITLTPGTITCSLVGNYYSVHALDVELTDGIDESGFVEALREFEKED